LVRLSRRKPYAEQTKCKAIDGFEWRERGHGCAMPREAEKTAKMNKRRERKA
jgi:hypothetical protein